MTPTKTIFPNCLKGGDIEKFKERNPIAVVRQATVIAGP